MKHEGRQPFSRDAIQALPPGTTPGDAAPLNSFAARTAAQFETQVMSPSLLCGVWRLVEFCLLLAAALLVYLTYVGPSHGSFLQYFLVSLLGAVIGVLGIQLGHGYEIATMRSRLKQVARVTLAWSATIAVVAVILFFLKAQSDYSRVWMGAWFLTGLLTLIAARLILGMNIRRWARNGVMERRAVIVGGGEGAESLIRGLERQDDNDIRICGIFDDRNDRRSPPIVAGYPKLGNIHELVEFARLARIDMLIVTLPLSAEKRVLSLLKELWVLPLDIRLSAHASQLRFRPRSYSYVGQIPLIDVFDRPLADWDVIGKRIFDLVIASLALVLLSPVFLATAIAIKLDSKGPVFFKQKRHGFNNRVVEVFKFRSMYHEMSDPTARRVVTKGDPRVTRVGRFIRKSSIDELPQLWNVIRGSLSLVGPRPHAVNAVSSQNEAFVEIVDGYFGRHKVKPGITGWAQIHGFRGEIDQQDKLKGRIEHDLYYIENWSILLDIAILAMTPISLLKTEHAY